MREVRSEKNKDQWAIRGVSLSWRRQYMVVLFKDGYDYEYEYEYEYVYEYEYEYVYVYHGISWFILVLSWNIMVYHGIMYHSIVYV